MGFTYYEPYALRLFRLSGFHNLFLFSEKLLELRVIQSAGATNQRLNSNTNIELIVMTVSFVAQLEEEEKKKKKKSSCMYKDQRCEVEKLIISVSRSLSHDRSIIACFLGKARKVGVHENFAMALLLKEIWGKIIFNHLFFNILLKRVSKTCFTVLYLRYDVF